MRMIGEIVDRSADLKTANDPAGLGEIDVGWKLTDFGNTRCVDRDPAGRTAGGVEATQASDGGTR